MKTRPVLILSLFLALACAPPAWADSPNGSVGFADSCIVACPAGDSILTVNATDLQGHPVSQVTIAVDFSNCPGVVLAASNPPGQYTVNGSAAFKTSDVDGRADLPLALGGACSGVVARVYNSGALIGFRPVASFDQDGDLAVTVADLALVSSKIGTSDRTADFNCDHVVTQ